MHEMKYMHFSYNTESNNVMLEYQHICVSTDLINIA